MRRTKPMRIGELLDDFLESSPLIKAKLAEARIPDHWAEIVGQGVAYYTPSMNLHKGVLYINVTSSVVRHEILMRRDSLKQQLNQRLGAEIIKTIIAK